MEHGQSVYYDKDYCKDEQNTQPIFFLKKCPVAKEVCTKVISSELLPTASTFELCPSS